MTPIGADELHARADAARAHAYAPYSGFHVGAAVEMADGAIHTGVNVENASYGLSICAERVALTAAVAAGGRRIVGIAVAADAHTASPCGACRQFIAEFSDESTEIHFPEAGALVTRTLAELLPSAFSLESDPRPEGPASPSGRG